MLEERLAYFALYVKHEPESSGHRHLEDDV